MTRRKVGIFDDKPCHLFFSSCFCSEKRAILVLIIRDWSTDQCDIISCNAKGNHRCRTSCSVASYSTTSSSFARLVAWFVCCKWNFPMSDTVCRLVDLSALLPLIGVLIQTKFHFNYIYSSRAFLYNRLCFPHFILLSIPFVTSIHRIVL